jgi:hypothetical protein
MPVVILHRVDAVRCGAGMHSFQGTALSKGTDRSRYSTWRRGTSKLKAVKQGDTQQTREALSKDFAAVARECHKVFSLYEAPILGLSISSVSIAVIGAAAGAIGVPVLTAAAACISYATFNPFIKFEREEPGRGDKQPSAGVPAPASQSHYFPGLSSPGNRR